MRVLQLIANFASGGGERVLLYIAKYLQTEGIEVEVVSMYDEGGTPVEDDLRRLGIPIHYLGKKRGLDLRMFGRISSLIGEFKPDVVHTHLRVLQYAIRGISAHQVPAAVHTVHNPARHEAGFLVRMAHRVAFSRGVVPVAIARAVEESIRKEYRVKTMALIENGIPVDKYAEPRIPRAEWRRLEGFDEDDVLIVNVGRLSRQKNHRLLVEAFANQCADLDNCYVLIAGEGEDHDELQSLISAHGLSDRMKLLGFRRDVPDILAASDFFALSSDWEGHPLCIMEAMAAGLTVLSTRAGGADQLVEDGVDGLMVDVGDVDAFGAGMLRLATDRLQRSSMSDAAQRRARSQFDLSVMGRKYVDLYFQLLQGMTGYSTSHPAVAG